MNCQLLIKIMKRKHLLYVFLLVTDLQQQVLRVLFCVYFLVEDLNFVGWREATNSLISPRAWSTYLVVGRNSDLLPVLAEMWIWVAAKTEPQILVEVLEDH
jgi:hypothetical protein